MALRWRHEGWRKLYVREEGTFAQLPLYTRALAAELLKIIDSAGRIDCNGKEPWKAVAWRLGATRGDRRMLKRDLDVLLADGYLVRDPETGDLIVKNFLAAHPHLVEAASSAHEGVDRIAVEDHAQGASLFDLAAARAVAGGVAPLHHGHGDLAAGPPPPVVVDQLDLLGWAAPPPITMTHTAIEVVAPVRDTVEPRSIHDASTNVQRKVTQLAEVLTFRSEDQRRSDPRGRGEPSLRVVPTGDQSPEPSATTDHATLARTLAGEQERLRRDIDPDAFPLPVHDTAIRIQRLLRGGWAPEALEAALAAAAAEARSKRTVQWFNGVDNWKEDSMRRALARAPARRLPARVAPTPQATAAPAPDRGGLAGLAEFEEARRALGLGGG